MPSIKPVSDLRNYNEVLKGVKEDSPVYLTRNGRGEFAVLRIESYEAMRAAIKLASELVKGERKGEEQGWLSVEEFAEELGL